MINQAKLSPLLCLGPGWIVCRRGSVVIFVRLTKLQALLSLMTGTSARLALPDLITHQWNLAQWVCVSEPCQRTDRASLILDCQRAGQPLRPILPDPTHLLHQALCTMRIGSRSLLVIMTDTCLQWRSRCLVGTIQKTASRPRRKRASKQIKEIAQPATLEITMAYSLARIPARAPYLGSRARCGRPADRSENRSQIRD